MDSDDAVDILEEVDDDTKCKILGMLDKEASEDVRLLLSYDEDEIGSYMTTNFILIHKRSDRPGGHAGAGEAGRGK